MTRGTTAYTRAMARPSQASARATSGYSGRLLVRMPSALHEELARTAEREAVSLNQLITTLLAAGVRGGGRPAEPEDRPGPSPRTLRIVLAINVAVLLVAAGLATALLVLALRDAL